MVKVLEEMHIDLHSTNTDQQVAAARQLCQQRNWDALPHLLRLLGQQECGFSVAQALVGFGEEVCPEVERALVDPSKHARYNAAWVLAQFQKKHAARPLLDALKEEFFNEQFLPALSRLGTPDLESTLVQQLSLHRRSTQQPSASFRASSFLWALTQMRSSAALNLAPHFTIEPHAPLVRQRAQQYISLMAPPGQSTQAG